MGSKLQAFQRKIYLKAKQNPKYKFYCLYDKVYRTDVFVEAYRRVKAKKGSAGIDGKEFTDIEAAGTEEFIQEIETELKRREYQPQGLREVQVPKRNGKTRTLEIPTIKDRVVQMAVKLIIEPIYEANFKESSYGYRPKRSAQQAIGKIDQVMFPEIKKAEGKRKEARTIDLRDCYNTIPHKEVVRKIAERIIDRQMIELMKKFLEAGTMKTTEGKDSHTGTPQGGVFSPLLANIYLDKIDAYWEQQARRSPMIRYADDIVILLDKSEEKKYEQFSLFELSF